MTRSNVKSVCSDGAASFDATPILDIGNINLHESRNPTTRNSNHQAAGQLPNGAAKSLGTSKHDLNESSSFSQNESSLDTARQLSAICGPVQGQKSIETQLHDMVCVGMGPASLAIGIALADAFHKIPARKAHAPRISFLEKQSEFAWHPGMQIADAKMQISFMKDLATPRDPTSPFSFANYLHRHGRFNKFLNLGTFLPSRLEYQAYMKWCASHFEDAARYEAEVKKVSPVYVEGCKSVKAWKITYQKSDGSTFQLLSRHVVMAAGGQPRVPKVFEAKYQSQDWTKPRVSHSSQYRNRFSWSG